MEGAEISELLLPGNLNNKRLLIVAASAEIDISPVSQSILAGTRLLKDLLHAAVGEAVVDEDLLLGVGGHGAQVTLEGGRGAGLYPQLG